MCDAIEFDNDPSIQTAPYQSIIIVTLTAVRASDFLFIHIIIYCANSCVKNNSSPFHGATVSSEPGPPHYGDFTITREK